MLTNATMKSTRIRRYQWRATPSADKEPRFGVDFYDLLRKPKDDVDNNNNNNYIEIMEFSIQLGSFNLDVE